MITGYNKIPNDSINVICISCPSELHVHVHTCTVHVSLLN